MRKYLFSSLLLFFAYFASFSQEKGQLSGNFQLDAQIYNEDTIIGATVPPAKMGINSYANFTYTYGNFSAGLRYEAYLPQMNGFMPQYEGTGIPYKYLNYKADQLEITVGNFYEQFGAGLTLRTYEEKNLGYDNALEGARVRYNAYKGIYLTVLAGSERSFWEYKGKVRGLNADVNLNELLKPLETSKTLIQLGTSFVSKFQADKNSNWKLPENVLNQAYRISVGRGKVQFSAEYAYKINDPSSDNGNIYKPGEALFVNASYSQKGLGVLLTAKRVDNMSFRADRTANLANLSINYLPDITKNHTYALAAMYPYATQLNGEAGVNTEITKKFDKNTLLGGKYGTSLSISFSRITNIIKEQVSESIAIDSAYSMGYSSSMSNYIDELLNEDIFYQDLHIELSKKLSDKLKGQVSYQHIKYNDAVIMGSNSGLHEPIEADVVITDMTYKFKAKKSIRLELQHLSTEQDYKNWAMALVELTVPNWFFTVLDQYNYSNPNEDKQVHYPKIAMGYIKGANRIELGYGKQRRGIVCVGGICRAVPASNGLTLSVVSSF
ncbi:MAG: hypothetical protein A2W91_16165 [Bacteroidetes bacterium GWF2_38_335]|nr:MAG: hypothetical protein A2W91_16165 [Bacteroidetes bacterium GWF2_38_335]OFY81225.1 MAG: hypothetical protein A2281_07140 [Bacteroidetes bacterium RIFOXYA12_FULL_38_20]HBS85341.1 hypothetical protein [Bacteroidales bacterium]